MTLILASRSPQRRAILEQLGVDFRVVAPDAEEVADGNPRAVVVENATRKARSTAGALVLGVDTEVVLDGRVFGQPPDEAAAELMLQRLSGRTHTVLSGVCVREHGVERTSLARTEVRFRRLEPRELRWYLAGSEWRGRAGGYAIQGRGAALVASIDGDFWNVVGLPVPTLLGMLPRLVG